MIPDVIPSVFDRIEFMERIKGKAMILNKAPVINGKIQNDDDIRSAWYNAWLKRNGISQCKLNP